MAIFPLTTLAAAAGNGGGHINQSLMLMPVVKLGSAATTKLDIIQFPPSRMHTNKVFTSHIHESNSYSKQQQVKEIKSCMVEKLSLPICFWLTCVRYCAVQQICIPFTPQLATCIIF
jgi:hypothetical protein